MNDKKLADCQFAVEGHTDAKGKRASNVKLSLRRAEAVRDYLVGENVSAARLKVEGKGPAELLDPQDPYASKNRRVQFEVLGNLK
jgi:OOP family OmpA-OmpF porin